MKTTIDTTKAFSRDELWSIIERAMACSATVKSPRWKEIYNNLATAADHLDAALARCQDAENYPDKV